MKSICHGWTFRWSLIAGRLPGRTDNEVKNYWNSHIKKKLIAMGIDPSNHKLSQTAPLQPQKNSCGNRADATSGSSSADVDAYNVKLQKPSGDNYVTATSCQKPSDNASCLEDETSGQSHEWHNLNLDLTISFPSPRVAFFKENGTCAERTANFREIDCGGSPSTLLLFRS